MDHSEWADAKKLLDCVPELNYMAQIVFLLFENSRAPRDSKDRYKVEIHFSPGAKGREEIIASGLNTSNHVLSHRKHSVPLRRMLPNRFQRKFSTLAEPIIQPVMIKRTAKSLPSLMSQKEFEALKEIASKRHLFDTDSEKPQGDLQPINGAVPSVAFRPHSPSSNITTITEKLSE